MATMKLIWIDRYKEEGIKGEKGMLSLCLLDGVTRIRCIDTLPKKQCTPEVLALAKCALNTSESLERDHIGRSLLTTRALVWD